MDRDVLFIGFLVVIGFLGRFLGRWRWWTWAILAVVAVVWRVFLWG